MGLMEEADAIKKKWKSNFAPGSIERVFEYNEKCSLNESGMLPVIIKPDPIELKKKKSIN